MAANRRRMPASSSRRFRPLADKAKPEYKRFAIALKSAGEIKSFNNFMAARVKETGSPSLIAQLKASDGNFYKILLKADTII
jgi:hypothetical protein